MADLKCSDCGGEMIGPMELDSVVGGGSGELNLRVMPTSGVVRKPTRSQVRGLVCTECGRVEQRADPTALAERWRAGER
jgi:hypothetical protein